ncbi:MAG: peptide ABC transporter substrate-binding protein [Cyanophyceae cyanobacterium]
MGRSLATAALIFTSGLTLAACGGAPSGSGFGGDRNPETLKLLYWQAPTILNPHLSSGFKDYEAARITYEPLASYDNDNNMVLFLAAEEPTRENGGVAEDGKSVTWKLKQDVKWSDGQPFTAADVVFTYEFLSNPEVAAASGSDYTSVESVEAVDDFTVRINFKDVTPAWSQPFVGLNGMILPRHIFEEYNGANAKEAPANLVPVGTGPYRVTQFKPGDLVVYEPNPNFRDLDSLAFTQVEIKGGGDATSAARAVLQTGDADFAYNPQVEAAVLKQLQAGGAGSIASVSGPQAERLYVNFTDPNQETADGEKSSVEFPHPFLSDKAVREALALSVNRQLISEQLYGPTGEVAYNILRAPTVYRSSKEQFKFDPEQAAKILDEAGWVDSNNNGTRDKDGVELSVVFATSVNPLRQKTQEIIKQSFEKLGVGVELKTIDAGVFFSGDPSNPDTVNRFETDLQMFTTGNTSPEPGATMQWWTCDEISSKANDWNKDNYARYCNPEYDALWERSRTELDPAKRQELFIQMNDLLIEDVAIIPLIGRTQNAAVSNQLQGVAITPWDANTWNVKDWGRSPAPE